MRKLKIKFVDFWVTFNPTNNFFWNELNKYFQLELSDNPEVLFYSVFGSDNHKYSCYRIFYTGENVRPNFKDCDLAISFDYNENSKHIRLPLYTRLFDLNKLKSDFKLNLQFPDKTKFCCMVVSNPDCEFRNEFFKKLSEYKQVDSGGRFSNNIGYIVPDKYEFIKDYKFVISFENSEYPGYTTEKIVEPMLCGSIPIYWGNPLINREFDTKSFVSLYDYININEVIDKIIQLDKDDNLYKEMQFQSNLIDDKLNKYQESGLLGSELNQKIELMFQNKPIALSFQYRRKILLLKVQNQSFFSLFIKWFRIKK